MSTERWQAKAESFAVAWRAKFGIFPTNHIITLGLSVAEHETRCGESSVATRNWGAVQKRGLTPLEKATLTAAGLAPRYPKGDFIPQARAALQAAIDAGTIPPLDHEELYVDSSPTPQGQKWYWVMFWAFPDDEEGAAMFIHVLAEQRASCKAVLESPGGNEQQLATAMYGTPGHRYFEGFYKPDKRYSHEQDEQGKWHWVEDPNGQTPGTQLNIDSYATALRGITPGIRVALTDWAPSVPLADESDPVAKANAARLMKLSSDIMHGQGIGLDALDALEENDHPTDPEMNA